MEDTIDVSWRKSSYSGNGGGNCVEVGDAARMILVRDTKDHSGLMLRFSPAVWRRFTGQVKAGRSLSADLPAWRSPRGPFPCQECPLGACLGDDGG
jgi:hypothetical protein